MKQLSEQQIKENIKKGKERLLDVQTRGDEAISKWDLANGYDADFYLNKIPILANHIKYYEAMLEDLYPQEQLSLKLW